MTTTVNKIWKLISTTSQQSPREFVQQIQWPNLQQESAKNILLLSQTKFTPLSILSWMICALQMKYQQHWRDWGFIGRISRKHTIQHQTDSHPLDLFWIWMMDSFLLTWSLVITFSLIVHLDLKLTFTENSKNRYPWLCSLRKKTGDVPEHLCAVNLLSRPPGPAVIVGAAHCTYLCR